MTFTRRDIIRFGTLGAVAAVLPAQRLLLDRRQAGADPNACIADRVLTGDVNMPDGFTVPPGETWIFDPAATTTVTVTRNVVVEGTLRMRPANPGVVHTLRFNGVDEDAFVGGHTMTPLATDVGLWVIGMGELDAQGTPRAGWNRTGTDPTWLTTDELVVAPTAPGDYGMFVQFAPFTLGATPPAVTAPDGTVHTAEVVNLTRNVRIEGTPEHRAHVMFVGCQRPQTLRHLAIRWMGPTKDTGGTYYGGSYGQLPIDKNVSGRYGLHFHHCADGVRGTLVEGVVVRDIGGNGFVSHLSNGITYRDCVAYDLRDNGYWWDEASQSHDIVYDGCAAMLVRPMPHFEGYNTHGFMLGEGNGLVAKNCVAVAVQGNNVNAGGFHWPRSASSVWLFEDNVAHNNRGPGIGVWGNDDKPHVLTRVSTYRNTFGILHGAYLNNYAYRDISAFGNETDLYHLALGNIIYERAKFGGVTIGNHVLQSPSATRFVDCVFGGQIAVNETEGQPGTFRFESSTPATDLTPAKFYVLHKLSTITVHNSDSTTFEVTA